MDPSPLVILLAETLPASAEATLLPLCLESVNGAALIEHWWRSLGAAGLADPSRVFTVTNAVHYKAIEYWSMGKGLAVNQIVNTGNSMGDTRVGFLSLVQAIRAARAQSPQFTATPVLVIAADSAPGHLDGSPGLLKALLASSHSTALLQPTPLEPSSAPPSGPSIVASFTSAVGPAELHRITALQTSLPSPTAPPDADSAAGCAHVPIVFKLCMSDADALVSPSGPEAVLAALVASGSFVGTPGLQLPVEAALAYSALTSTVAGVRIDARFRVGAADGRPHRLPAPAEPGPSSGGGLEHHLGRFVNTLYSHAAPIHARAYARVGVLGNPSDGYGGKTASLTIANFSAEAWLHPASDGSVTLVPHPIFDPMRFASPAHLSTLAGREGYSGGVRLMAAVTHRFYRHLTERGIALPPHKGFSLRYHTTVPRQVGLAGSSAIVTALVRVMLEYYGYGTEEAAASIGLSRPFLPNFVLAIESEELGITAGLQDRVVQAYEGFVHMDFLPFFAKTQPTGNYTKLPVLALPPLFLAYAADPSDSGKIHAPVKQRWLAGDAEVVAGMQRIASLADEALRLVKDRPYDRASTVREKEAIAAEWARAMATNFNTRRSLWGDGALGKDNIRMVEISRETGASGKFPGSGGAIVGVVDVAGIEAASKLPLTAPSVDEAGSSVEEVARARVAAATEALRTAYLAEGFVFTPLVPYQSDDFLSL